MVGFYYKDTFVATDNFTFRRMDNRNKTCFCCNKEIVSGEDIVLLINNYKHIPNMVLHKNCFEEQNTTELCQDIEDSYKKYKELHSIFGI